LAIIIPFGLITGVIMGEQAVKGAKHRKRLALDSYARSMMEGSQAERNKRAIAAVKFCASRGRAGIVVQRIQKLNLCTRKSGFGGVEKAKPRIVHQE
jgi:hypothetical protein